MSDELNNENTIDFENVVVEEKLEDVVEPAVDPAVIVEVKKEEESPALAPVENGVLGSSKISKTASKPKVKTDKVVADDKVAVFSTSNVTWNGVGKVYRGINIVTAAAAERWLERPHIRIATPEEVAKEYGL